MNANDNVTPATPEATEPSIEELEVARANNGKPVREALPTPNALTPEQLNFFGRQPDGTWATSDNFVELLEDQMGYYNELCALALGKRIFIYWACNDDMFLELLPNGVLQDLIYLPELVYYNYKEIAGRNDLECDATGKYLRGEYVEDLRMKMFEQLKRDELAAEREVQQLCDADNAA